MKVILVSTWFFEYLIELSNALSEYGCEVVLVLSSNIDDLLGEHWKDLLDPNIKIKKYKISPLLNGLNLFLAPYSYISMVKYITKEKPDVIHIQECHNPLIWLILPVLKNRFPIVSTLHDVKPHVSEESIYREVIVRLAAKYIDAIIVHGQYLKDLAVTFLRFPRERIYVIPHGEFSIYNKFSKKRSYSYEELPNTVLFFGRILKYKGLKYLIKAEPIISKNIPNLKIIITGTGKDVFDVNNRYIPNEEVPKFFQQSSVVVLPYIDASQSGIIPIAYIFRKPVVATTVGALPEVIDHEKTGILIPPKDEKALANAVIDLLINPKLRKKFGQNAYNKALRRLSWNKIARMHMEVYENVTKGVR